MTGKLVAIGDLHFQDNHVWDHGVCENVISYLTSASYNNSENTLVLLGDLTESHLNSGIVYEYLTRLFAGLKYKQIIIITGNHDLKRRAGKEIVPYEFLKKDPRVYISLIPGEEKIIDNFSCLMLPHVLPSQERPSVNKFYSSLSGSYDFIFGHVADETAAMIPENQRADLSKLSGIKVLGHIHTRTSSNYIGSIYAGTVKEVDDNRAVWIFDSNKQKTEVPLPIFVDYQNITYPEPLRRTKAMTSVYTFYGADEGTIREKYGNVYIRRVIRNLDSNLKTDLSKASQLTSLKDAKDISKLIESWSTTLKEKPSDKLLESLKHYSY